ncbi:MAG: DUF6290 family protein [Coriobacteriia bacterium]|nr:DUF6290 family protein [Coriobacteriia bacterium]
MPTTIRLDKETEERLTRLARDTGRTRAFYLRKAIEKSLPDLEWEYDLLRRAEKVRSGEAETYTLEEVRKSLGASD